MKPHRYPYSDARDTASPTPTDADQHVTPTLGILAYTFSFGLLFAIGGALTAFISMTSSVPMLTAYALLTVSGTFFIGGIILTALIRGP